jgi:hypothetical protein
MKTCTEWRNMNRQDPLTLFIEELPNSRTGNLAVTLSRVALSGKYRFCSFGKYLVCRHFTPLNTDVVREVGNDDATGSRHAAFITHGKFIINK